MVTLPPGRVLAIIGELADAMAWSRLHAPAWGGVLHVVDLRGVILALAVPAAAARGHAGPAERHNQRILGVRQARPARACLDGPDHRFELYGPSRSGRRCMVCGLDGYVTPGGGFRARRAS